MAPKKVAKKKRRESGDLLHVGARELVGHSWSSGHALVDGRRSIHASMVAAAPTPEPAVTSRAKIAI
jgi:hypothetical protein